MKIKNKKFWFKPKDIDLKKHPSSWCKYKNNKTNKLVYKFRCTKKKLCEKWMYHDKLLNKYVLYMINNFSQFLKSEFNFFRLLVQILLQQIKLTCCHLSAISGFVTLATAKFLTRYDLTNNWTHNCSLAKWHTQTNFVEQSRQSLFPSRRFVYKQMNATFI